MLLGRSQVDQAEAVAEIADRLKDTLDVDIDPRIFNGFELFNWCRKCKVTWPYFAYQTRFSWRGVTYLWCII